MVKWIVIGVVVLSVVILIVAFIPIAGRLAGLRRAVEKLQKRQAEAATLEQSVVTLQERIEAVQAHLPSR